MDPASRKKSIERRLWGKLVPLKVSGLSCFYTATGGVVVVDSLPSYNALVLGHADNLAEAEQNRFEDGDLFYLDEMDEDAMLAAMLLEIENS